jgi:chromosome segregation protein
MHLKEIRMENFKTFRRKVTVPIHKGFTGITGPNGSGKSNIADAILFVLGPRSSKMVRAKRLSDLIFHGNDQFRASKQCQVSLVFDNVDRTIPVDTDEVELRRVLKISNTDANQTLSYFYVNGRVSSQSEFENILAHAHLSAEGYNIVLQGHVSEFVNKTPVKVREEVDDIAGIRKYDEEIDSANGKKEQTIANMEKIRWHLDFIKGRLRELKKEKEEAEKYRSAQMEINKTKATLYHVQRSSVEGELRSYDEAIKNSEKRKIDLRGEMEKLEVERERTDQAIRKIESEIEAASGEEGKKLKEKLDAARLEMMRARDLHDTAQDTESELKKEGRSRELELKDLKKRSEDLTKELERLGSEIASDDSNMAALKKQVEAIEHDMERTDTDMLSLRRDLTLMNRELENKRLSLSQSTIEREKALAQSDARRTSIADLEQMVATLSYEMKDAKDQLSDVSKSDPAKELKPLQKEFMDLRGREKHLVGKVKELESEITSLNRLYTSLKVEYETSEKLKKGVSMAVDDMLTARDKGEIRGIYGTIGELGKVKEQYNLALEVAAGGRVSALIVEDDSVAAQCIERLKKKKLGRATFLPLNKVKGKKPGPKALMILDDPHVVGNAIDLIAFDERYAPAFSWVFGDTVVVDDMETLRRVMGGVKIVTLTGEIAGVGGDITGGSMNDRKDRSSFGKRSQNELDDVSGKLQEKMAESDSATVALNEIREKVNAIESRILKITSGEQDVASRKKKLEEVFTSSEKALREREADLETRRAELVEIEASFKGAEAAMAESNARITELTSRRDELSERIEHHTPKAMRDKLRELRGSLDAVGSGRAGRVEERDRDKAQLEMCSQRAQELTERISTVEKGIAQARAEAKDAKAREDRYSKEVKALESVLSSIDVKTKALYAELTELNRTLERIQGRRDACRGDLSIQDQIIITQRANIRVAEEKLADILREMKGFESTDIGPGPYPPERDLTKRVREIETILENAGNVNLKALEEYESMDKKKDEIGADLRSLEKEKEELEGLIAGIHSKRTTEFMETFKGIDENFRRIYGLVSGGGEAFFELENPNDPLSAGLIIRVKPPKKKMTSLYSLSGGEKSLTSMAFIFSVQAYDPSPFYLLDEVDQNLDAVNAEIIAKMIAQNSARAQFVLVSLRKVTLKEAHHLYGVTLQGGDSVLVGRVDLRDVEEYEKGAAVVPAGGEA